MRLKGNGCALIIDQPGIGGEITGEDHPCAVWRLHDLILVRGRYGNSLRVVHKGRPARDAVVMQADGPAFFRFHHLAAKGLGEQLVAETDADYRAFPFGGAQKCAERLDESVVLVHAMRRAGDQITIKILD